MFKCPNCGHEYTSGEHGWRSGLCPSCVAARSAPAPEVASTKRSPNVASVENEIVRPSKSSKAIPRPNSSWHERRARTRAVGNAIMELVR
jgi:predicted  nucleic acid-binding Zn-ribbon protein